MNLEAQPPALVNAEFHLHASQFKRWVQCIWPGVGNYWNSLKMTASGDTWRGWEVVLLPPSLNLWISMGDRTTLHLNKPSDSIPTVQTTGHVDLRVLAGPHLWCVGLWYIEEKNEPWSRLETEKHHFDFGGFPNPVAWGIVLLWPECMWDGLLLFYFRFCNKLSLFLNGLGCVSVSCNKKLSG